MTVSTTGQGADELWSAVEDHRTHAEKAGTLVTRRRQRIESELRTILVNRLEEVATTHAGSATWRSLAGSVATGQLDPYTAVEELLQATIRP
jgi:LAO/AO transport system kinase